jgi:glycosyltransferase involved in cell wall biosynthesis
VAAEQLSRYLAARGHQVTLFARGGATGKVAQRLQVEPSWYLSGRRTEALSHSFWSAMRTVRGRYDVVHFHALGPGCAAIVTRLAGIPSVLTVQGLDWQREKWDRWERRVFYRLGTFGLRQMQATIAVAPSLVPALETLGARNVTCIPNGFSDPGMGADGVLERYGLSPGRYVLMLTRLVPEKNLHRVIPAFLRTNVEWPLVVAGGGSHSDDYVTQLRRSAQGSPRVRFIGVVHGQAKAALLQGAGAFLNASAVEGLSVALLEALGTGIPTAVSPIPANLDIFTMAGGGPSPILLDPEDEERLPKAIQRLIEEADGQRHLWRAFAVKVRSRFDWQLIAEQVEGVYRLVVDR